MTEHTLASGDLVVFRRPADFAGDWPPEWDRFLGSVGVVVNTHGWKNDFIEVNWGFAQIARECQLEFLGPWLSVYDNPTPELIEEYLNDRNT